MKHAAPHPNSAPKQDETPRAVFTTFISNPASVDSQYNEIAVCDRGATDVNSRNRNSFRHSTKRRQRESRRKLQRSRFRQLYPITSPLDRHRSTFPLLPPSTNRQPETLTRGCLVRAHDDAAPATHSTHQHPSRRPDSGSRGYRPTERTRVAPRCRPIGAENWVATATCWPPSPTLPPKGEGRRRDGKLHDEVSHAQFRWRALDCPPRRPSPFGGRVGDGGNRTAKNAEIRLADPASELASFRRLWIAGEAGRAGRDCLPRRSEAPLFSDFGLRIYMRCAWSAM